MSEELGEIAALREVSSLTPFAVKQSVPGGVHAVGGIGAAYAINLHSRIASRVLLRVTEAGYRSENDVYTLARDVPWEQYFGPQHSLRSDITAQKSPLPSLNFVALRIKDAVCDRLREKTGERPSVDTVRPDVRLFGHLTETHCTLYLDLSGEPLFKRGWRLEKGDAPLKENLAAGILRLTGWQPEQALYDPMCGSGTFLVEAAQMALAIPPGMSRRFGFERLHDFQTGLWQRLKEGAQDRMQTLVHRAQGLEIAGSDISTDMLSMTDANWQRAGLPGEVPLKQIDARFIKPPFEAAGMLLTNPPYGERIATRGAGGGKAARRSSATMPAGDRQRVERASAAAGRETEQRARVGLDPAADEAANQFASAFASTLKQHFSGWTVQIFTGDLQLPKRMRLKESRRTPLFNGPIECRLFRFEMVAGGMRDKPAVQPSAE